MRAVVGAARWARPAAAALSMAAACSLQSFGAPSGDLTLVATFDDVQSLVVGHSVQISDVRVGSVTDIRLEGYRAKVTMSVEDGHRVPEGTSATVAKTSILGENYVELNLPAGKDMTTGPFMADGATISETSVEPDIEQVTQRAGPLIDALGAQDVNAILDAAATGIGGKGEDLNRLLRQTTEVTAAYAESRRDLARTIDGLAKLGDELAKGSDELDKLPGSVEAATARLNHGRKHVKKTLRADRPGARGERHRLSPARGPPARAPAGARRGVHVDGSRQGGSEGPDQPGAAVHRHAADRGQRPAADLRLAEGHPAVQAEDGRQAQDAQLSG
ncbi:MCE family protein [Planobispora longispora]|uniref:MCE family protein n=1 Tax=Planobispora longispora TaxID=28887 RepID=UPI00360C37CD